MSLRILRNDITKMSVDAIVNTANCRPTVGPGCDFAIYTAAGFDKLLQYRTEHIGQVEEGDVFITPAFDLPSEYIIHAVSPAFKGGDNGEEEKLRSCYRKSLQLAVENSVKSIAFPLISTGSFGYPKEEGMRIAVDEINGFLMNHDIDVSLVVFDEKTARLGKSIFEGLDSYIDQNYMEMKVQEEYDCFEVMANTPVNSATSVMATEAKPEPSTEFYENASFDCTCDFGRFSEEHESAIEERMKHMTDTFSEYLIYLIDSKGLTYPDVYKRAIIDKKVFSKIKNNHDAHPKKITAMCLCVGAMLSLDETIDLLARAGYALSPCDKTDIIFRYFIENGIYDMIELDIQLEEHNLPCLIS